VDETNTREKSHLYTFFHHLLGCLLDWILLNFEGIDSEEARDRVEVVDRKESRTAKKPGHPNWYDILKYCQMLMSNGIFDC